MPSSIAPIRFVFRGQIVSAAADTPTRSVLQWLREDARACGTKEGCAEGDCGACSVIVAELAEAVAPGSQAVISQGLALRPVNACIRFLPTLHGKALLTIEDLAQGKTLHPAQQALVDCHGSQCGFCTPGFAINLALAHEAHAAGGARPSRSTLADALAGNLCRCTGYRPILDAGEQMLAQAGPRLPLQGLREQLLQLLDEENAAAEPAEMASAASQAPEAPEASQAPACSRPSTLAEFATLRLAHPEALIVAGGTDVGLWVTKQLRELGPLLFIGEVAELRRIEATAEALRLGAGVPLEDAWAELVQRWPSLAEMYRRFAGPPVRHAGTLVGNLANGSPIGDSAPVLIALGASLRLQRGAQQRELLLQDFQLGYRQNALLPGEFIESVSVPLQTALASGTGWQVQAHKLAKRHDCDISALSAGFALRLEGERVAEVRLAFGGMAATVRRAARAEAELRGQPWDEARLRQAQAALAQDFQPLSDLRASAAYRLQAAAGLLQRLWLSTRPQAPLPPQALRLDAACAPALQGDGR